MDGRIALPLPDPPLEDPSQGIGLRPWGRPGDAAALAQAWADPLLQRWTAVPGVRTVAAAGRWIAGEAARRASGRAVDLVVHPLGDPDRVLGEVGLLWSDPGADTAEAGWWLAEPARGAGHTPAALRLVTAWAGHDLGLASLSAVTEPDNPASGRVAELAGWVVAGALPDGRLRWTTQVGT